MNLEQTIALTLGVGWASGINLYATILTLGILQLTGAAVLPPGLEILSHPAVLSAAGFMFFVEFFADKVPGFDSVWDTLHTFVRIPAGVILASKAVAQFDPGVVVAAGLVGGALAATTHATKSGTRMLMNTSPEPVTNWITSLSEDMAVILGVWAAVQHPMVFLALFLLFVIFLVWFLPKLFQGLRLLFQSLSKVFKTSSKPSQVSVS